MRKRPFSGIPRTGRQTVEQDAIAENIEILTGQRGDGKNRALLYSDLVDFDKLKRQALIDNVTNPSTGILPEPPTSGVERPHAPVDLSGVGGFTFIALSWDRPTYRGHAYAEILRADEDNFSKAVKIATTSTDIFSDTVEMGSHYFYWVRFVNVADMVGPTQGVKGLEVETQNSAEQILGKIGGQIEESHLGDFLTGEIEFINTARTEIEQIKVDFADVESALNTATDDVEEAKTRVDQLLQSNNSLADDLINIALVNDENWRNNATKLLEVETSIGETRAKLDEEVYTKAEATEAIAAAATTIRAEVEAAGLPLDGSIEDTYYTKATANQAIALADQQLKATIEDPNGSSIGATLKNQYYTSVKTNEVIATASQILKSEIENPQGNSLGATLIQDYSTTTDMNQAISNATQTIKSQIEDPLGNSVGANLVNNYMTSAQTDEAISESVQGLIAELEDEDGNSLGSRLLQNYSTKVNTDEAIARSLNQLSSSFEPAFDAVIENALANDAQVDKQRVINATITNKQETLANEQEAVSESLSALESNFLDSESQIVEFRKTVAKDKLANAQQLTELNSNIEGVSANLATNYLTEAQTGQAIAAINNSLSASIEGVSANLEDNYYTTIKTDEALSAIQQELTSEIGDVSANLSNNYLTQAETDSALSALSQELSSDIEGVNSKLANDYYTSAETDRAISVANQVLESQIGDNSAALQTLSQTVANNDDEVWALWGVKTNVNGLTSSVGLINDGSDPIFAVKGAKFSVINDNDSLTPVFGVDNGKAVMNTALIDQAFIKSLVTDDVLANRLMVGSQLTTPSINYNPSTGARSQNFSISPNGTMHCKYAELRGVTIRDKNGNVVMSSGGSISHGRVSGLGDLATRDSVNSGDVSGLKNAVTTFIDSAHINSIFGGSAVFSGRVYAERIEGDVYDAVVKYNSREYLTKQTSSSTITRRHTLLTVNTDSNPKSRKLYVNPFGYNVRMSLGDARNYIGTGKVVASVRLNGSEVAAARIPLTRSGGDGGFHDDNLVSDPFVIDIPRGRNNKVEVIFTLTLNRHARWISLLQTTNCVTSIFYNGGSLS